MNNALEGVNSNVLITTSIRRALNILNITEQEYEKDKLFWSAVVDWIGVSGSQSLNLSPQDYLNLKHSVESGRVSRHLIGHALTIAAVHPTYARNNYENEYGSIVEGYDDAVGSYMISGNRMNITWMDIAIYNVENIA